MKTEKNTYYTDQLNKLQNFEAINIKLTDFSGNETNFMALNSESIYALSDFLFKVENKSRCKKLFLDYFNNFLSIQNFADYYSFTLKQANWIIEQGKKDHENFVSDLKLLSDLESPVKK